MRSLGVLASLSFICLCVSMNFFSVFHLIFFFKIISFWSIQICPVENEARRLKDVPDDIQQLIFEHLDLLQLLNVAKSDEELLSSANWIFRRLYGKMDVEIVALDFPNALPITIDQINHLITIRDFDLAMNVLTIFGLSISKLKIEYVTFDLDKMKQMNEVIGKYCSNSLIVLDLNRCNGFELIEMAVPMPKLRVLSFKKGYIAGNALNINRIFPNMTDLIIDESQLYDELGTYNKLENLTLNLAQHEPSTSGIKEILRQNPQLKSLEIKHCPLEILRTIKKHSPNLENLVLIDPLHRQHCIFADKIHFGTVKSFKFREIVLTALKIPFTFDPENLRTLDVSANGDLHDIWLDFILQNKELKNLRLIIDIKEDQLRRIGTELQNLIEITITVNKYIEIGNLIKFIEDNNSLEKITLPWFDRDNITELNEKFEQDWNTSFNDGGYCLERKVSID